MDITKAAAELGRLGGIAARGRSGAKRRYPPCTAERHRFWKGICSKCGVGQVTVSSGNVFRDLGLPDADRRQEQVRRDVLAGKYAGKLGGRPCGVKQEGKK
jgi:hypothetical protein